MFRTRRLLPLLLLLVAGCFQPVLAGQSAPPMERSELPTILTSVYDHWEKDLQHLPVSQLESAAHSASSTGSDESLPYILLTILLISAGVLVVGDASRVDQATLIEMRHGSEDIS